jgi:ribosomal protein S18 acetylase RimI-like enzyme
MFHIRPTRREDAELLPDVERSAGRAFLSLPDLAWIASDSVQSVERHLELIAGGYAWTAIENAVPVGFISAEKAGDALHIWELAVHAGFQGRGIGRALIEHAANAAKADALRTVTLTTFRDVAWNEPFYRKLGFRTLPAEAMPNRIRAILDNEVAHGLPREKRCGMVLAL